MARRKRCMRQIKRVLAALRNHTFYSLGALNELIGDKLAELNAQRFQKLEGARRGRLEQERRFLCPLPEHRYDLARWSQAKVNIDYHVAVDNHFYSVPYQHVGRILEVRRTESVVELYLEGKSPERESPEQKTPCLFGIGIGIGVATAHSIIVGRWLMHRVAALTEFREHSDHAIEQPFGCGVSLSRQRITDFQHILNGGILQRRFACNLEKSSSISVGCLGDAFSTIQGRRLRSPQQLILRSVLSPVESRTPAMGPTNRLDGETMHIERLIAKCHRGSFYPISTAATIPIPVPMPARTQASSLPVQNTTTTDHDGRRSSQSDPDGDGMVALFVS